MTASDWPRWIRLVPVVGLVVLLIVVASPNGLIGLIHGGGVAFNTRLRVRAPDREPPATAPSQPAT